MEEKYHIYLFIRHFNVFKVKLQYSIKVYNSQILIILYPFKDVKGMIRNLVYMEAATKS
jgi:hypothetical protein